MAWCQQRASASRSDASRVLGRVPDCGELLALARSRWPLSPYATESGTLWSKMSSSRHIWLRMNRAATNISIPIFLSVYRDGHYLIIMPLRADPTAPQCHCQLSFLIMASESIFNFDMVIVSLCHGKRNQLIHNVAVDVDWSFWCQLVPRDWILRWTKRMEESDQALVQGGFNFALISSELLARTSVYVHQTLCSLQYNQVRFLTDLWKRGWGS